MSSTKKETKPKLKLVVRCLPAQLTESSFASSIEKFNELIDFWYYEPGRITEKKTVNSRAYINFISTQGLEQFFTFYNGHTFVTNKGKEQKAIIEYAPSQKVPSKGKKKVEDNRVDTIESDPEYLKFLEELESPQVNLPSAEEQLDKRLAQQEKEGAQPITTPLLEYIRERRALKGKRGDSRKKRGKERKGKDEKKDVGDERKKKEKGKRNRRKRKDEEPKKEGEKEGDKKKNGVWIARNKSLEHGQISIQAREPSQGSPNVQNETHPAHPNPNASPSHRGKGKRGPRRGGRNEGRNKMYAPKQALPTPAASNNGP